MKVSTCRKQVSGGSFLVSGCDFTETVLVPLNPFATRWWELVLSKILSVLMDIIGQQDLLASTRERELSSSFGSVEKV